jgi:DNA-binding response OmpR family regulator
MTSRILVVDDDIALAEMIGIVLRTEGFEPLFCADGTAAVEMWREERPDLVLLDLMLPGMDGIEICTRIRAESGVPIIMLTARTDTADVVRGLESGADDYIVKPFNPKELVARIRTRLRPPPRRRAAICASATSSSMSPPTKCAGGARSSRSPRWSSSCWWPSPRSRSRCSRARCCSSRSGATTTRPTPVS